MPAGRAPVAQRRARCSPTLASVLVRRGYCRPRRSARVPRGGAPGARSAGARRHGRGRGDDPGRGRGREADLRPRRLRRRRHLRNRARGLPASRARRRPRLAPAVPVRRGIRAGRPDDSRSSPTTVSSSCSRSTAASPRSPRWRRRKRLGLEVVVTDHHRPRETSSPTARSSRTLKGDYPFAGLCGTGVVWKLAEALLGAGAPVPRPAPRHRRARHRGRRRPARRREPRARPRRAASARPDPEARAAGADAGRGRRSRRVRRGRDRLPARPADQRVRPARPARGRARAAPHRTSRRGETAGRAARGSEPGAAGGRGEDPACRDRRDRVVARGAPAPPWVRRRRRGLARGRDRHRRLAARRALRPSGRPDRRLRLGRRLEGIGPRGRRVRPPRRARPPAPRTSSASAAIAPPPASRSAPTRSRRSPRRSPLTRTPCSSDDDLRPRIAVDAIVRGSELGLPLVHELERLAPFGLGNPGITLLVDDCELDRPRHGRRGQAPALPRPPARPRRRLGDRVRLRRRSSTATGAIGHYDIAFRLEENRWNGTVSPQLVVRRIFDTDERYEELRGWFAEQWRRGEAAWTPDVRAVFDELGLSGGGQPSEPARVARPSGGCSTRTPAARAGGLGVRLSVSRRRAARRSRRALRRRRNMDCRVSASGQQFPVGRLESRGRDPGRPG